MPGNDPVTNFWNEIGATMRDDIKVSSIYGTASLVLSLFFSLQTFFRSGRPLLLGHGLSAEFVDAMERNACAELDEAVTPIYVLIQNVYARKRH